MIHSFDADSADVAVAGSGGPIDVAGETEFKSNDSDSFWNDIADLNMILSEQFQIPQSKNGQGKATYSMSMSPSALIEMIQDQSNLSLGGQQVLDFI